MSETPAGNVGRWLLCSLCIKQHHSVTASLPLHPLKHYQFLSKDLLHKLSLILFLIRSQFSVHLWVGNAQTLKPLQTQTHSSLLWVWVCLECCCGGVRVNIQLRPLEPKPQADQQVKAQNRSRVENNENNQNNAPAG